MQEPASPAETASGAEEPAASAVQEPAAHPAAKRPDPSPFLPLVGVIARILSRRLSATVEFDELINDGVLGLIDALRRYDAGRGVAFSTYAGHRIRGAMLDGLRVRDPLPRTVRRALKASRVCASSQNGNGGIQFVGIDEALMVPDDEGIGPEARILEAELLREVHSGLRALPPRDREVLVLRMLGGMTLRAVAAQFELSITRIAEIQARGLVRMRRFLAGQPMIRPRGRAARYRPKTVRPAQEEHPTQVPNDPGTAAIATPGPPLAVGAE